MGTTSIFPETKAVDVAFPVLDRKTMAEWVKRAEEANYDHRFGRMASMLFFKGGKVPKGDGVSDEEYSRGRAYLQVWLGSWDPKHEEKELVAGYILSLISKLQDTP